MGKPQRYEEQAPLTDEQLEELTAVLKERRQGILREAAGASLEAAQTDQHARVADENDLASAEWDKAFEQRMQKRGEGLLKKLDKALKLVDEGEYGECENCGNDIGYKRLRARPEASMCIECKEEQERIERNYQKTQKIETSFPFK